MAADKMAELIGGEGEVAIIAHDQTSRTGIDRAKGFTDQITAKYPNITIVDTIICYATTSNPLTGPPSSRLT